MSETTSGDGKTIAIVSYLWLVGWVIALIMHNNNKSEFGAFHLRQSLGLMILWFVVWVINIVLTLMDIAFLGWIFSLGLFVFWLLGFIGAIQGEKKLIPVVGEQFQNWFKGIG